MRTSPIIYRPATTAQPSWQQPVLNIAIRFYAKKIKDNKKRNESKTAAKEEIEEYVPQFNENELTKRFEASIAHLRDQLVTMRVGRANPALLDNVRVRIENSQFSLRDLAQITVRDPQTLLVTVHDNDYTSAVEKSIREAGLNLNPIVDNKMIKVPIPKPTKESRDKMAKLVSNMGEQFKLKVRAIRQDGMKHLKQDLKHQPADQIKKLEKTVQNMTDKYNKTIDDILKSKIKEIQS
ncbi:ribosome recycling factor domain-containing protein [Mycotypha africana]|uniref:ribosome recycling factor domain-containing protein n=1 Tax=Mycotypha africana TaxID=64632 RepID=UPI0022FFC865|nr:ribosome recycling factor domain-containing protein [Mycotypha africana]KAI8972001.1 ribosome recycling factor domain-containing protein [Mycotypha africana]